MKFKDLKNIMDKLEKSHIMDDAEILIFENGEYKFANDISLAKNSNKNIISTGNSKNSNYLVLHVDEE